MLTETGGLAGALQDFSFRIISPDMPAADDGNFYVQQPDGTTATYTANDLETEVIHFGARDQELRELLTPLLSIKHMSRLAYAGIVNTAVREMSHDYAFVNVGVWHGFSLLAGMAGNDDKVCIGVDNFSQFDGPKDEFLERFLARRSPLHRFYERDYRDFFAEGLDRPIGVYLYDGAHDLDSQYRGLLAAEPFLADDAVIIVDDINWPQPRAGTTRFVAESSRFWTILVEQRTASKQHPTFWNGVMVLQAGGDERPVQWAT